MLGFSMLVVAALLVAMLCSRVPEDRPPTRPVTGVVSLIGLAVLPALAVALRALLVEARPAYLAVGLSLFVPLVGAWCALMWWRPTVARYAALGVVAGPPLACMCVAMGVSVNLGMATALFAAMLIGLAAMAWVFRIERGWGVVAGLLPLMAFGPLIELLQQLAPRHHHEFQLAFELRFAMRATALVLVGFAADALLKGLRGPALLPAGGAFMLTVVASYTLGSGGQHQVLDVAVGAPVFEELTGSVDCEVEVRVDALGRMHADELTLEVPVVFLTPVHPPRRLTSSLGSECEVVVDKASAHLARLMP
jgi:hypothetical protein